MSDLIRREDVLALFAENDNIPTEIVRASIEDLPAVQPYAREAALREAAYVAINACLVPPDGGNPTEAERLVCEEAYRRILALIDKPATGDA